MIGIRNKNNGVDMLNGSIWNKLIAFTIPIALSSILQQLFNASDTAIAGRFAGSVALAAVGSTSALINLIINLFVGCATGANVLIARLVARRDEKAMTEAVSTAILFGFISGVALIFIGGLLARPLLVLMGSPDDVIDHSTIYMQIFRRNAFLDGLQFRFRHTQVHRRYQKAADRSCLLGRDKCRAEYHFCRMLRHGGIRSGDSHGLLGGDQRFFGR